MDLTELVRQAQAGDQEAMGQLYEQTSQRVYALALRLTNDPELAMDVVQETYLSALQHLDSLRNPEAFVSWIFQIAANRCHRLHKQQGRFVQVTKDEDEDGGFLEAIPDPDEGILPESVADNVETRRLVMELVERLPEAQRECVILYYFSHCSVEQIAEIQGCAPGTVKSRLNYARKKLREDVLALEERDGIRLHTMIPVGVLFQCLTSELPDSAVFSRVWANISVGLGKAGAAGTSAAASAGTQATGNTATAASAAGGKAAVGTAVKAAASGAFKLKLVAGVAAGALLIGGGVTVGGLLIGGTDRTQQEPTPTLSAVPQNTPEIFPQNTPEVDPDRQAAEGVLDTMPYYGDISKCQMTAEQALLLADLIARGIEDGITPFGGYSQPVDQVVFWDEPYTVQGYDGPYETDRSLMMLGDFSGDGMPYLYCFSSLVDSSFEIYGWNERGQPIRIIGDEAYHGRTSSYLYEADDGTVKMNQSGASGAARHGGSVFTFRQGGVEESETWLEEYDDEKQMMRVVENGVETYYTEEEWEQLLSEASVPKEKPPRTLPYRPFDEVEADACSPREMVDFLNRYAAALNGGDTSQNVQVKEPTDEARMAKDMYNIMREIEQTGTISGIPESSELWGLTLDDAKLLDMNGDGIKELILVSNNNTSYVNAFLVQWSGGKTVVKWSGLGVDADVSLVQEKSSGDYAVLLLENQGTQDHTYIFTDRTDTFSLGVDPGGEINQEEYDRLYAIYEANCARYEVIEQLAGISNPGNPNSVEQCKRELQSMMQGAAK